MEFSKLLLLNTVQNHSESTIDITLYGNMQYPTLISYAKSSTRRMHSTRMRTTCSSSHLGGLHQAPPWDQAPPGPSTSPELGTPRPGTPQTRHPSAQAPPVVRHTPVNILPCPKLRLRVVIKPLWIETIDIKIRVKATLPHFLSVRIALRADAINGKVIGIFGDFRLISTLEIHVLQKSVCEKHNGSVKTVDYQVCPLHPHTPSPPNSPFPPSPPSVQL